MTLVIDYNNNAKLKLIGAFKTRNGRKGFYKLKNIMRGEIQHENPRKPL